MQFTKFPQANTDFGPPAGLAESQVHTIPGFIGPINQGACDGLQMCVVAHTPSKEQLEALNNGAPIFLTMIGGLAPHFLTTNFEEATNPA